MGPMEWREQGWMDGCDWEERKLEEIEVREKKIDELCMLK